MPSVWTAVPITSAGRFSLRGPRGIATFPGRRSPRKLFDTRLIAVLSITGFRYLKPVLAVCNPNPILQSGVLDSMGAISRLCHFAQRCDSDGLPPLGYASGEDHGTGAPNAHTPVRTENQTSCDNRMPKKKL